MVANGDDGLLVPPRDYVRLGEALRTVMSDEALRRRMGDAGRAKAELYSWEIVSQRVLDHYGRAIEKARTGVT